MAVTHEEQIVKPLHMNLQRKETKRESFGVNRDWIHFRDEGWLLQSVFPTCSTGHTDILDTQRRVRLY